MSATLRVVLDRLVRADQRDLGEASAALATALVDAAPSGCDVAAIAPRPGVPDAAVPGLASVATLPLGARELAAAWQLGAIVGVGKGLIHSPTLLAPYARHDRVNETHQIVSTVWDMRAWEAPGELPRAETMLQKGLLRRAGRFADAVVVPSHAIAARLQERGRIGGRIRVIAGAPPVGFAAPGDAVGRLRTLGLPASFVATSGGAADSDGLTAAFRGIAASGLDLPVVVLDAPEGEEPTIVELAAVAGLRESRVHVRGPLEPHDRAAVLGVAELFVAPSTRTAWPWRLIEALAVRAPVVALDTPSHREALGDAGISAPEGDLGDAITAAAGASAERLRVLSADRAKAYSWREAAERVWQLHADL